MDDGVNLNEILLKTVRQSEGVLQASLFLTEDYQKVLELEKEAEKNSLMGLGIVFNSGLREVLNCEYIIVALTDVDFDWWQDLPCLVLKKGDQVVGEEVRDEQAKNLSSNGANVWFMHEHFVIYKDRISFPKDLKDKTCYFDTPCLPSRCVLEDDRIGAHSIIFANPSVLTDNYLKDKYFKGMNKKGAGTILVGLKLGQDCSQREF